MFHGVYGSQSELSDLHPCFLTPFLDSLYKFIQRCFKDTVAKLRLGILFSPSFGLYLRSARDCRERKRHLLDENFEFL